MGNLEHNIKEAFEAQDAKSNFEDKDALWNRLDGTMHKRKGVAAFWRVAAVFLGLLLTAGVFAGINSRAKQQVQVKQIQNENAKLIEEMKIIRNQSVNEVKPEVKIVEKEKIVYRDRIVYQESDQKNAVWESKYLALADSLKQKQNEEQNYQSQIQKLQTELNNAQQELIALENSDSNKSEEAKTAPFELKSERIELGVQKKPAAKNPEMEVKVFQRNFIENRNNLNKNILRK